MLILRTVKNFLLKNKLSISIVIELSTLFIVLALLIGGNDFIKNVNLSIYLTFLENRSYKLVDIFKIVTHFGESNIIALFSLILLPVLWFKNKKAEFFSLFTLIGSSGVLIYIFKHVVKEPRPEFGVIAETSYSFPSGHTTISIAFYGLIIWYLFIKDGLKKKNILKVAVGTIWIILIALSRLILGVHYYFDVIGGLILGTICLITSILVFRFVDTLLKKKNKSISVTN